MARRDKYILKSEYALKNLKHISAVIVVSFTILILRLLYLQVAKHSYFLQLSKRNTIRLLRTIAPRGDIITADGVYYAKNKPSFSVYLFKTKKITKKYLNELGKLLNMDEESLEDKLKVSPLYSSVLIKSGISRKTVFELLFSDKLSPYINISVTPKRFYPNDAVSHANIVGYISEVSLKDLKRDPYLHVGDYIGRKGIEEKYDKALRGKSGLKEIEVSSTGAIVKTLSETPPKKGENIKLTVNSKLQEFIYNLFKENKIRGSIVVMRPNGAILAIVNSDSFDPNYFVKGLTKKEWQKLKKEHLLHLFDISTQGAYPPGSLIKPFIALAALKEHIITPNTILYCPYAIKIGKYTYRDWRYGGFGRINLIRALESSSDVFFYQIGMKLGIERIDYNLSKFGFGQSPDLFPYCTPGNLPSKEWKFKKLHQGWYIGDTISTAIGQGYFLASPLQVALAFSMIANNGIGYQPYLAKTAEKSIKYVFKSKYYKEIKKALWLVVNGPYGTGHKAQIKGLDICGKTGTSQVVTSKVYKKIKKLLKKKRIKLSKAIKYFPHAWFASFAPLNKPQVVVVVFLFHGEHSSNAAAFAKIVYEELLKLNLLNGFTNLEDGQIHGDNKKSDNSA